MPDGFDGGATGSSRLPAATARPSHRRTTVCRPTSKGNSVRTRSARSRSARSPSVIPVGSIPSARSRSPTHIAASRLARSRSPTCDPRRSAALVTARPQTLGDAYAADAIVPTVTFVDPRLTPAFTSAGITINDILAAILNQAGPNGLPWETLPVQGLQPYSDSPSHVTYTMSATVDCSVCGASRSPRSFRRASSRRRAHRRCADRVPGRADRRPDRRRRYRGRRPGAQPVHLASRPAEAPTPR